MSGIFGKTLAGSSNVPRDPAPNAAERRLRTIHDSLTGMTRGARSAMDEFRQMDPTTREAVIRMLGRDLRAPLERIRVELGDVAKELRKVQTAGGAIGFALKGGGEKLVGQLADDIDEVTEIVRTAAEGRGMSGTSMGTKDENK